MKIKIIAFILCVLAFSNANAKMPFYDDDAEFDNCTHLTGDWNRCMSEETSRDLNDIKIIYRDVLSNPKLSGWNPKPEQSRQMLRDMYDSWIAFRNRLCSLSKVASRYTGGWKNEELACTVYYTKHHKDHMRSIINMLRSQAVAADDFITDEHDAKYEQCLKEDLYTKCLMSEYQRSTEEIKELYKKLSTSEYTAAWNNGSDLSNGNYRDMFDSWIAYRNRLCSLSVYAYKNYPARSQLLQNQCLQYLNREKLEALTNLYKLSKRAVSQSKAQKKKADGGKNAGKAIKPLEKRVETTESLTGNNTVEENKATEPTKAEDSSRLPAWARQK